MSERVEWAEVVCKSLGPSSVGNVGNFCYIPRGACIDFGLSSLAPKPAGFIVRGLVCLVLVFIDVDFFF